MEPRSLIMWILLPVLVVLAMSAGVQAHELREVPASEILEKIRAGEDVNYDSYRIIGELDVRRIDLETVPNPRPTWEIGNGFLKEELKVVESKITIVNSVFENNVDFSSTQFEKPLNFKDTKFLGRTKFIDVTFSGDVHFGDTNFSGVAYFAGATFSGDVNFVGANFSGVKTYFAGEPVYDYPAIFGSDVNFAGANFSGDTYFSGVTFSGDAHFDDADFSGDAIFNSAEFNNVVFSDTTFTKVSLHEIDFKSMEVEWSSLKEKDVLVFDGPTYIKLIKNFREMEQFTDADDAYYQYRRQSQANKEWSFSKLGDIFMWRFCGYGVRPWYAAAWAVIILVIFTPIYFWRGGIKRLKENNEDEKQDVSLCDAFYFSMTTFTTLGYGDLYPADRSRMVAVMIEGLLGWLILALFLVTLANVMIRP